MANNISSIASAPMPASARDNGQSDKPDTAVVANAAGRVLPETGKALPRSAASQPVDDADLRDAVSQINQFVQSVQRDLSFSIDEGSGRSVIKVIDRESGELVRQIPSQEVLALASYLGDLNQNGDGAEAAIPQGILISESI